MDAKPSTHDQNLTTGAPCMEYTKAQELIKQLKDAKTRDEVTFPRIMERMEKNGKYVSLTTLRRVFAEGSEKNASSFSYEGTLMPIAEALLDVEDVPTSPNSPYAKELDALKAVIHVQNEEIARLHDLKEHLESRITFLLEQIERKDRRMDEKDDIIRQLMERCLKE